MMISVLVAERRTREMSMSPAPREAMKVWKEMTDVEESSAPTRKAPRRVAKDDAYPMFEKGKA